MVDARLVELTLFGDRFYAVRLIQWSGSWGKYVVRRGQISTLLGCNLVQTYGKQKI